MRIRTRLMTLVFATLLPASIAGVMGIGYVYRSSQDANWRTLRETSRALAMLAENETDSARAALEAMAMSPAFEARDMPRLAAFSARLAARYEGMVAVLDGRGLVLASSMADKLVPGQRLDPGFDPTLPEEQLAPVSPLYWSPHLNSLAVALHSSTRGRDGTRYVLAMEIPAARMQRLLDRQQLPPDWTGTIVDQNGVVAARSRDAERFVGQTASGSIRHKMLSMEEGSNVGRTLSGEPVHAFFSRAPRSNWIFVVSVPQAGWRQPAQRAALLSAAALALIVGLGLLAAAIIARRVTHPVESLRAAAEQLGRGEAVQPARSGILELDLVASEIEYASRSIRGAEEQLQRKVNLAVAETERTQQALLQAQKLEALGRLTGGIAHDFNNVLQTLSSGLQIARRLSPEARVREMLSTCERALQRAAELTGRLMAFGRVQEARLATIDPQQQLEAMLPLLKGALPVHIELKLVMDEAWPVTVDPTQLELALLNLVINARDAMPGGGLIELGLRRCSAASPPGDLPEGDYVLVDVVDSGQGMSQEVAKRALEPFFTTKKVGAGTGLGLPQAWGFARQSGGTLVLDSAAGRGTRVVIWLPRSHRELPAPSAPGDRPPAVAQAAGSILFVEDDELVREVVVAALAGQGFAVSVANDGEQALQMLADQRFNLVFSDVVMPGKVSGIDLARTVREEYASTHVLLATGYSRDEVRLEGVRVLAKPYDVTELLAAVQSEISEA